MIRQVPDAEGDPSMRPRMRVGARPGRASVPLGHGRGGAARRSGRACRGRSAPQRALAGWGRSPPPRIRTCWIGPAGNRLRGRPVPGASPAAAGPSRAPIGYRAGPCAADGGGCPPAQAGVLYLLVRGGAANRLANRSRASSPRHTLLRVQRRPPQAGWGKPIRSVLTGCQDVPTPAKTAKFIRQTA